MRRLLLALVLGCGAGNGGGTSGDASDDGLSDASDAEPLPEPFFPEDFAKTYTLVRDCRRSIDHDLRYILVMADDLAVGPYKSRKKPFPVGSTLVKIEHQDELCTTPSRYTAMQRQEPGAATESGDWLFQRVTLDRVAYQDSKAVAQCVSCHETCGPPDGYDWTCAAP